MNCRTTAALDPQAAQSMMGSSNESEAIEVIGEIPSIINTWKGNSDFVQGS